MNDMYIISNCTDPHYNELRDTEGMTLLNWLEEAGEDMWVDQTAVFHPNFFIHFLLPSNLQSLYCYAQ